MPEISPQVVVSVLVPALVSIVVSIVILLGKGAIERRQASRRAGLTLLWLAKTLRRNLTRPPDTAAHLSMSVIVPYIADIAQNQEISRAFDDIEKTVIMWKRGVYEGRQDTDQLCKEALNLLQSHIGVLSSRYAPRVPVR